MEFNEKDFSFLSNLMKKIKTLMFELKRNVKKDCEYEQQKRVVNVIQSKKNLCP